MAFSRGKLVRTALLAAGFVFLVAVFAHEGFGEMWARISRIGVAAFGLMLALSFLWNACSTLGWYLTFDGSGGVVRPVSYGRLFFVRWAGESINTITPLMNLGGEPVRIALMRRHLETHQAAATVILDKSIFTIAGIIHMVSGVVVGFWVFDLPESVAWIEAIVAGILMMAAVILVTLIRRGKTLLSLVGWLRRAGIRFSDDTLEKVEQIDDELTIFYRTHRARFWTALTAHLAGRMSRMLDVLVVAWAFGIGMSAWEAHAIAAATVIINVSFSFIPQQVGANEGGHGLLFKAVGLGWRDGLSTGLVRRARTLVFALMGYVVLVIHQWRSPDGTVMSGKAAA
ncbi:MAG: flippase-like domain-containing protein [Deltaproteobacteria bacterium]|nr:flippase-like domain-containing protein [Deltaproteobacteria bacterium]